MLTAIVGIGWGDEGKGRMVDLLSRGYGVVARYQGGNNAGHTVVNDSGKFILNLLPSGVLRPDVVNVMGPGMVIDLKHLRGEMDRLEQAGIALSPKELKISDRATLCLPCHVAQDIAEEDRLKDKKFGSTRRGIGPVYGDKHLKKALKTGDLLDTDSLARKVRDFCGWKQLVMSGYGAQIMGADELMDWLREFGDPIKPFLCDTGAVIRAADGAGQNVMFEAQLGALRDVDYGIWPMTTSSSTLAAYAPIGAGVPGMKTDNVIGVMKAYSTCVGEGPFVAELFGGEAEKLRAAGGEYGAATGRPRRVGPFDVPASAYGVMVQGANEIALTKMDVLSYLKEIPVCEAYEIDGKVTKEFPYGDKLTRAKPVLKTAAGWACDISGCRKESDLPKEAMAYIGMIEKETNCRVRWVSVGPEREAYVELK